MIGLMDEYRNRMDMNLSTVFDQIHSELISRQDQLLQRQQHSGGSNIVNSMPTTDIELMIQKALAKYDADKTGEADFALESSGKLLVGFD
ncbi:hypothetical protein BLA29_015011 [Euroglyphus maynei]|uniref:Uncharacterized protein n=1 Tax=Euroglyphus maynei TaxID=6958 RepID=A0A1Y3AP47_EURMA|nr:hypothetical protein BLA29_015011 [Euroglyphus maynei]